MMDLEIASVLIFFSIITALLLKDREKIEFKYGIVIRRWERGRKEIDRFVRAHPKAIKAVGIVAVAICILASIYVFAFLLQCTFLLELQGKCFAIVLPRVEKVRYPEQLPIIAPRFWPWIISIFLLVAAHESMHAIFARAENVRIKSYGLIFLLFFPLGAFVDPNLAQLRRLTPIKKLRVYAAGSFGNFILGAAILLISFTASFAIYQWLALAKPAGVDVVAINATPACDANLTGTIFRINGDEVKDVEDLRAVLEKTKPEQNLTAETTKGKFVIQTVEHPEKKGKGYIGILVRGTAFRWKSEIFRTFSEILFTLLGWTFILNLGVGLFNLLPIKPLDGGLIFEELANKIFKEKGQAVVKAVSLLTLSLLILNLWMGIAYYKPPPTLPLCPIE